MVFIAFLIFGELPIKNRCIFKPQKLSRIGLVHVFISNNNSQNNFLSFKDSQFISCHSRTLSKKMNIPLKKSINFQKKNSFTKGFTTTLLISALKLIQRALNGLYYFSAKESGHSSREVSSNRLDSTHLVFLDIRSRLSRRFV